MRWFEWSSAWDEQCGDGWRRSGFRDRLCIVAHAKESAPSSISLSRSQLPLHLRVGGFFFPLISRTQHSIRDAGLMAGEQPGMFRRRLLLEVKDEMRECLRLAFQLDPFSFADGSEKTFGEDEAFERGAEELSAHSDLLLSRGGQGESDAVSFVLFRPTQQIAVHCSAAELELGDCLFVGKVRAGN